MGRRILLLSGIWIMAGIISAAGETRELNLEKISDDLKFKNGLQFIHLKKPDKAVNELNEYLEIYNNGIHRNEAYRLIAEIYLEQFEYQRAIHNYRLLYEEFSNTDDGVYAFYQIGLCYKKMGYDEKAADVFQSILSDHPDSVYAAQAKIQIDLLTILSDK